MDPDACLDEIRALIDGNDFSSGAFIKLADHFESLDLWLTTGGFLPREWQLSDTERPTS